MKFIALTDSMATQLFWQRGYLWLLLAMASMLPFCFVTVLPMQDLDNHLARFYVFLNLEHSEFLQRYYSLHWSLIGNLGVDLLVRGLGQWLGAEFATKMVVALIPPLTVAGIYAVSRSVSGAVTPAAIVSISLVYNWPFITGFVNFSLSAAIALLVFALWVRVRELAFSVRLGIFTPLAFLTWLAHTAGWGLLGLMVLAYELSLLRTRPLTLRRLVVAGLQTTPFALIVVFIIFWRVGTSSGVAISFDPHFVVSKLRSIASIWRERYEYWDIFCACGYVGLTYSLYRCGGHRLVIANGFVFLAISVAFVFCPYEVFKSAYADRRLLPYALMFLPLSIGVSASVLQDQNRRKKLGLIAAIAVLLFALRIGVSCYAWNQSSRLSEQRLSILRSIPIHSRIFGIVVEACATNWSRIGRPDHLQQYAVVRRESMINGMFQNPGLNQVQALYARATGFDANMLAVVRDECCPVAYMKETFQSAMSQLPLDLFDYVWIIREGPTGNFQSRHLRLVDSVGEDTLYQIVRSE